MFFIIKPPSPSQHQHEYPYQNTPSLHSYKAHSDMSAENEDAEYLPPHRRSVKCRKEPPTPAQYDNDDDIIIGIGKCIENLNAEKDILKAENAQLTQDIRAMNALRLQQAALEAEMQQIVEGIHDRHARIEGPHISAAKRARGVRKKAAQIEEEKWAELKLAEGMVEPFVEVDQKGEIALVQQCTVDAEKERLFDAYTEAKSSYKSLNAAITRLRQSRAEFLDLGDFVSRVELIAIGDAELPHDREKTPPARARGRARDIRNSFPLLTRDDDERREG